MSRHSHSHSHSHSHDDAPLDGEQHQVPEEDNLLGAIVFFAYIVAALLLTGAVIVDLRRLSRINLTLPKKPDAKTSTSKVRSTRVAFLVFMALVSFTTLSYHMLNVLIQSYSAWTLTHGAVDPNILYAGLFPLNILDYIHALACSIWHWSTTSTLFADFATAILANSTRRVWTRMALYYTLTWNVWMSDAGIQRRIPHLPLYFLLAQILPISLTQNLFLLAFELCRSSPTHQADAHPPSQSRSNYLTYLALILGTFALIYRIDANLLRSPTLLISQVFLIRLLLFAPLVIPRLTGLFTTSTTGAPPPWSKSPITKFTATIFLGYQLGQQLTLAQTDSWARLAAAVDEHPAISALGYDLALAFTGLGGYASLRLLEASEQIETLDDQVRPQQESGKEGTEGGEELLARVEGKSRRAGIGAAAAAAAEEEGGLQQRLNSRLKAQAAAS